jgi:hypothetical protein
MAFDQSTPFFIVSCDKSGYDFISTSRFALNRHTAKQHPPKPPRSKTFKKCQRCDHLTDNSGSLRKHEKNCLKRDNFYECKAEECEKRFGTETSQAIHFRRKHPKIIRKKSKTFNQCQRCSYTTSHDIGRLRKHEKSCSKLDSSQFETCKHKHCGFKSSEKAVYHHIIKNHGLSCNYCPFETKAIEELRKHRRTHTRTLHPKKCTIGSCEFKGSQYLLTKHLENVHGVIKPNQSKNLEKCQRCDHISTKESIRKHWKRFSKTEELFHCGASLCEKKFCSEISLSLHRKRTHPEFHLNKCQR